METALWSPVDLNISMWHLSAFITSYGSSVMTGNKSLYASNLKVCLGWFCHQSFFKSDTFSFLVHHLSTRLSALIYLYGWTVFVWYTAMRVHVVWGREALCLSTKKIMTTSAFFFTLAPRHSQAPPPIPSSQQANYVTAGSRWRCELLLSASPHQGQADWPRLMGRCGAKRGRGVKHLEAPSTSSLNCPSSLQEAFSPPALLQTGLTLAAAVGAREA